MKKRIVLIFLLLSSGCLVDRQPVLQPFVDVEYWVVREPMKYEIGTTGKVIEVPSGFVTDFASIPPSLRSIFPRMGLYIVASIVHDYLYWNQSCTKEDADDIFYLAMNESGVSFIDRHLFYALVNKYGKKAWAKNANDKAQGGVKVIPGEHMNIPVKDTWHDYLKKLKKWG